MAVEKQLETSKLQALGMIETYGCLLYTSDIAADGTGWIN